MRPEELIEQAKKFRQDDGIICQVVPSASDATGAWNCTFELFAPTKQCNLNVISVTHPDIKYLPPVTDRKIELQKCWKCGSEYLTLPDHPRHYKTKELQCPHCMSIKLEHP